MVAPPFVICDGLPGAIFQQEAVVVPEHSISDG